MDDESALLISPNHDGALRALRYELHGLTAVELGKAFDLERLLNHDYLPSLFESDRPDRRLASYVGDYLKEEVAAGWFRAASSSARRLRTGCFTN